MKVADLVFGLMASHGKERYSFDDLRYLAAPFGVAEAGLRTNLARMAATGVLETVREGRKAFYRFGGKGRRIAENILRGFQSISWDGWDRAYWGVAFSVPDSHADIRHYIRKKLTKYRFACMNPGLWIRPAHPAEAIPDTFSNILSSGYCRLISFANYTEFTPEEMRRMWSLGTVNDGMIRAIALLDTAQARLPFLSPEAALVEKMTVGDAAVNALFLDPMLPPEFLPDGWAGDDLREKFLHFDRAATAQSKPYWEKITTEEAGA